MNNRPPLQQTIQRPVRVEGFGYWSGRDVTIEFRPSAANCGIVFFRDDLPSAMPIPVDVAHRQPASRRTNLAVAGAGVEMVEHIVAALAGLEIDNCEVHVDAEEMPGCDGSSWQFVEALLSAGIAPQSMPADVLKVRESLRVGDDAGWVEAHPSPTRPLAPSAEQPFAQPTLLLQLNYHLDYGPGPIGGQSLSIDLTPERFVRELAPARTFLLQQEANWLRQQGLGQRVTWQDLLVFDEQGPIDNPLRFRDECVRHKTLDLLGDLALTGCRIVGRVVAYKSGHRLNAELCRALLETHHVGREVRCA